MPGEVRIDYNPYIPRLKVYVNGRNVSRYSYLTAFENLPFTSFAHKLFAEVDREINGDYDLLVSSDETSGQIFRRLADAEPACKSFGTVGVPLDTPLEDRLTELSALGADCDKEITVYLSGDEGMAEAAEEILEESGLFEREAEDMLVYSSLPCFKVAVRRASEIGEVSGIGSTCIYLCSDDAEDALSAFSKLSYPVFVLKIGAESEFLECKRSCFLFSVDADGLWEFILQLIMDVALCPAVGATARSLTEELERGDLILTESETVRLALLPRTRPIYSLDISDTTYLGRETELHTEEYPFISGGEYSLISSDRDVIDTDGMRIKVKDLGSARITLNKNSMPDPLFEKEVKVISAQTIRAMSIFPEVKKMRVGEEDKIKVNFYPQDAVNSFEIKWRMEDESVATVTEDGVVRAIACGVTNLIVYTPDTSDRMQIRVG